MTDQDPKRLLEGGTDDPTLLRALQAGRGELPDPTRLTAIAAKVGLGAGAAAPVAGVSTAGKLVALALVGAAATAGGWAVWRHGKKTEPPAKIESTEVAMPVEPSVAPAPAPAAPVAPAAIPRASQPRPTVSGDHPGAEIALLQTAKDALARDPGRALWLCEGHASRFPSGLLAQEREVIAIEALKAMGRGAEANARATRFQSRYPGSSHWRRIQEVLAR